MTKSSSYPVDKAFQEKSLLNRDQYDAMYKASILQPDMFWNVQANKFLSWEKRWESVSEYNFQKGETSWFTGGKLNVTTNCIDRQDRKSTL